MAVIEVKEIDRETILWLVDQLDDFEKDKAVRKGLLDATTVFTTIGRRNLRLWMSTHGHPNGVKGNLLKSFNRRVKKSKPGALAGFGPNAPHVWLVNDGTSERFTKGAKSIPADVSRGIMPASYFWSDAKTQGEGKAVDKLIEGVKIAIERINERRS